MDLWALLVSSFLAATILPLASEIPLAVVVRRNGYLLLPVAVATFGNFLGACTPYALARTAAIARFSFWRVLGKAGRYATVAWIALSV